MVVGGGGRRWWLTLGEKGNKWGGENGHLIKRKWWMDRLGRVGWGAELLH